VGKLFHGSYPKAAFDEYGPKGKNSYPKKAILNSNQTPAYEYHYNDKVISFPRDGMPADRTWQPVHTFDWGLLDVPDHEFRDAQSVKWTLNQLQKSSGKPIFLGVGFHLPRQPMYALK